jgi:hypothetical protein
MAPKNTLNAQNLEALGAERLAELLMELSSGDAAVKRRLRLALAGARSPADASREIRKRLAAISRSRTFIDWQKRRAVIDDIETQRRAIIDHVGPDDPKEALDLMWSFTGLGASVFARCDDSSGTIIGIFHQGTKDLARLAETAQCDAVELADRTYQALLANDYGQYDRLITTLSGPLGGAGLAHLKQRLITLSNEPTKKLEDHERRKIGWSSSGPIYEDDIQYRHQASVIRFALSDIADAQGDVDSYIAQYDARTTKFPKIAAEISRRLVAVGRVKEALQIVDAAERGRPDRPEFEWENARIAALDALGRSEDAQAARWSCFARFLSERHLREHLKRLPDFHDIEAETRALDIVEGHADFLQALWFLASWPSLDRAAKLILQRPQDLDGNRYEILTPVAEAMAGKHPLEATLALRAMIEYALDQSRTSRYKHAARHLLECAGLAANIGDFGKHETHPAFVARMRGKHGKKTSFWSNTA